MASQPTNHAPAPVQIFHMLPQQEWDALSDAAIYAPTSLAAEGFIHCTGDTTRLIWVANHFYRQAVGDFVILTIDSVRLQAPLQWDEADGFRFPHIYGPLNLDAVTDVQPFPRTDDGQFLPLARDNAQTDT